MGRRKRGWNVAAGLSIADLQRLIEEKGAQVEELQTRREAIASELAQVDAELAAAGGGKKRGRKPGRPKVRRDPGRPKGKRGPGRPKGSRNKAKLKSGGKRGRKAGPMGQSELHNLIRQTMAGANEPMKAADIAKKVIDSGYKTKSKVFHLIVGQRLAEMRDVKKPSRGLYAIK